MHICPCSMMIGIFKKIWIQTYFGPVTVDSVEIFRHFAFWRHGSRLASFFIVPQNCIFWGATFELIKNLATLVPEKLQGFYETLLYHCYTLSIVAKKAAQFCLFVCMCVLHVYMRLDLHTAFVFSSNEWRETSWCFRMKHLTHGYMIFFSVVLVCFWTCVISTMWQK